MTWRLLLLTVAASIVSTVSLSAQPLITELQPRGAQKGKPFTLTLAGRNLGEGVKIRSTMPASFTLLTPDQPAPTPGAPMQAEGRYATFLVEPTADVGVGVYPIRVVTAEGISNVQLFTVGVFPELTEDESRPGALPNTNDRVEDAQPLPPAPFTMNGTLRGPERDIFRLSAKAGDKRVFEVEARRCGSAIDPLLEILDANGRVIAGNEDAPLLGLDARVEVAFPRAGDYYVVVRDSRFSTQTANFYRLKVGSYSYPHEVFPLGGRRGEVVETSLGPEKIKVDLRNASSNVHQVFVNMPGSPALPVPFAVGDDPEVNAPVGDAAIGSPVTINARLTNAGQVDRYTLRVPPSGAMTFRIQARELETSKLMAVITVRDEKGNVLGRSGDEPLAEDLYNVNQSRTAGDPILRLQTPAGVNQVTVSVEDLALRGGPGYAYRLNVKPVVQDFRVSVNVPFVNVPADGSVAVPVTVQRQGVEDEIQLRIANAPKGLRVEGGYVVAGLPVKETPQNRNSRGVLILTAEPGHTFESLALTVEGVATLADGSLIVRKAEGPGMIVNVAGASEQGAVDRQRSLTAPWLGLELVTAPTKPRAAKLEVTMLDRTRMQEGDQIKFRWKWTPRDAGQVLPRAVNAEMVGSADVRLIDMQVDAKDSSTGTFVMTTTKLTRPSKYDVYITGRLTLSPVEQEEIVSRPITVKVDEVERAMLKLVLALSVAASAIGLAAAPLIAGQAEGPRVTFVRDVAPILNKVGCTAGTCHGAAKGKNGFKLSLRGYDPQLDYEALLYDLAGRRFNRADPGRSLMLAKPSLEVAHGGGRRFAKNSDYYKTIYAWIAQGVPFGDPAKETVAELRTEPKEIFMTRPGETASLKVVARYKDDQTRDVTRETTIESNVPDVASVESDTSVIRGERVGEATLLVRYQGTFGAIPVTVLNPKPGFVWQPLPQHNYIDRLVDAKLERLKIQPSPVADDVTVFRRLSLDLTGRLPSPEGVRAFLDDPTPSRMKRAKAIDKLIASSEYVDHWTVKWGDLLQSSRKYLGEKGAYEFQQWIHDAIASNRPYDKLVRELLTARGSSYDNPAANYFRVTREPKPAMEKTTQVFLGVRMVCAQCHDHPFERWTQNQYYQMSAFFSAVGIRAGYEVGEEIVFDQRSNYEMKHPKDGRFLKPQFMLASSGAPVPDGPQRRDALAEWLTSKDNPYFARAIANRMWSYFVGKGIIDPVDDIRASNPPSNPALLEALTKDFVAHDFDLRYLMRTIVSSRTYQVSIVTNEWNANDRDNFSHAVPRRLSAEELMDGVSSAAGARARFPEVPEDTAASQLVDPHIGREGFLDVFGRPPRESSCECERRSEFSLPQALNLVNGRTISDAVADPNGRVAKLVLGGKSDEVVVNELYLAALGRPPTREEQLRGVTYLSNGAKGSRAQDLLWALLNSKAFLYIY